MRVTIEIDIPVSEDKSSARDLVAFAVSSYVTQVVAGGDMGGQFLYETVERDYGRIKPKSVRVVAKHDQDKDDEVSWALFIDGPRAGQTVAVSPSQRAVEATERTRDAGMYNGVIPPSVNFIRTEYTISHFTHRGRDYKIAHTRDCKMSQDAIEHMIDRHGLRQI